ncbi:MAG: DUF6491 family protein [Rhodanobacteraceae bacterium]
MKASTKIIGWVLLLIGAAALPALAQQTASERTDLQRYEKYAEAPVDHVRFYQISGFQYLSPDTVAIRFGVNQMYLVSVETPCVDLAFANAIGLTSQAHTFYRRFDFITFSGPGGMAQRCQILKIVPVNELKMKQDQAMGKAPASGSSD